jgi:hypothetical protein
MKNKTWIIPIVISLGALGYGIFAITQNPNDAFWLPVGIISLVFTILWFTIFGPMLRNRRILKTGESGSARVLRMFETGVTVNDDPMVKLELEVTPQRGSTYITNTRVLVSRLNPMMYGPGTIVAVKIDPKDQMQVVIDTNASATAAGSGMMGGGMSTGHVDAQRNAAMTELLEASDKIRKEVLDSPSSKTAVGTILSLWNLDVTINNIAVGMEFLVEVEIPGELPFKTEIKGAVASNNLAKYSIGKRVTLKYDPADPRNRITITGVV